VNTLERRWDPRLVLLIAVPALVLAGLAVRAAVQPGPAAGWRINRAVDLAADGRHQLALARFQAVIEEQPREPQAWVRAGRALRVLGRPSEAAVFFRRAAELDPRDENVRFELARGLLEAGLPALADQAADETLALEPDHAGAHYVKAAVAAQAGDAVTAAERLDRALELEPAWPDRFRTDPAFDPVRNDRGFLDAVLARRVPGLFR
jgi:tetratricopeptide (TPR) repeat protein